MDEYVVFWLILLSTSSLVGRSLEVEQAKSSLPAEGKVHHSALSNISKSILFTILLAVVLCRIIAFCFSFIRHLSYPVASYTLQMHEILK